MAENREEVINIIRESAPLLSGWFSENMREMPWRSEVSPYRTWVSEIMLQQTRVDTVIPYFERFIKELPDVAALSRCPEDRLLKLWEGLGYYSRVRNMKKAAALCMEKYGGALPSSYEELLKLPGIGAYTAGAISSIAFHKKEPVVDGNVLRVITRLAGLYDDISSEETKREFREYLKAVLLFSKEDPAVFNQSLMELGALVCVPNGAPDCKNCPVRSLCRACICKLTDSIPVNNALKTRKITDLTVFILKYEDNLAVEKRAEKGLLSGLYGFPSKEGFLSLEEAGRYLKEAGVSFFEIQALPEKKHIFTHIEWHMKGWIVSFENKAAFLDAAAALSLIPSSREDRQEKYALATAFKKWNLS